MNKYVIIGNGTAAVGCVEGIRSIDRDSPVTIISDEKYHTYSRPLISYLLCGKTTPEKMKYRKNDFYKSNNAELMINTKAVKINEEGKCIVLDNGETIPYDKLLVATGASPFVPETNGYERVKNKFTFLSLDDALNLDKAINKKSRVLIIGAGPVGLKCAEGIRNKVKCITVADMAERVLSAMLDKEASETVGRHLKNNGIELLLNDSVERYEENTAYFKKSKKTVDFDVLVTAVGVRANSQLIGECGGKVEKGIVINEKSETSLEDIYAAGDCTQCRDITSGDVKCLAILPNAYMQGHAAGVNMAGGCESFDKAIPMNSLGLFGLHVMTAGNYDGDVYSENSKGSYKKLVTKNGILKGYILVGDVNRAGIYTSLIREQTPLEMLDFELIKEKPQLMAFTRKEREKKLSVAH